MKRVKRSRNPIKNDKLSHNITSSQQMQKNEFTVKDKLDIIILLSILLSFFLMISMFGYFYMYILINNAETANISINIIASCEQIPTYIKQVNQLYRYYAELNYPLKLNDSIGAIWKLNGFWTISNFKTIISKSLPVYKQYSNPVFITFHDDKPLGKYIPEKWEDFNVKVFIPLSQILAQNHNSRLDDTYYYFSQDIAFLENFYPNVKNMLESYQELILSEQDTQINLWIGRQGIVTHMHYDCTYNFFIQLQGRKRFTFYAPSHLIPIYPCLHPHYAHTQFDPCNISDEQHATLMSDQKCLSIELDPGDMLVIPPFWLHHVETLSESMSINIWSSSPQYDLINRIFSKSLPFKEATEWSEQIFQLLNFIHRVSDSAGVTHSALQQTLLLRYDKLYKRATLFVNGSIIRVYSQYCNSNLTIYTLDNNLITRSESIGELFKDFDSIEIRIVCLANFIEHLVNRVLGVEHVYPFLKYCLDM